MVVVVVEVHFGIRITCMAGPGKVARVVLVVVVYVSDLDSTGFVGIGLSGIGRPW